MKMRTLKSRLMAGLLCLVMVLTLLPASVLAVGEDADAPASASDETGADYTPAEPQDAATVQAMIDALPDADDAADMTEEELEAGRLFAGIGCVHRL